MKRVKLIGAGSEWGCDAVGLHLVGSLDLPLLQKSFPKLLIDTELCTAPALLPSLLVECDAMILFDALLDPSRPVGEVVPLQCEQLQSQASHSSHGFDLPQALQLTTVLGELPSDLYLLGVVVSETEEIDWAQLQQRAARVIENLLQQIVCATKSHPGR